MKLSYSKISTYEFCPKKYEFQYIKRIKVPTKLELVFGNAIHETLEENFNQKLNTKKDMELEELQATFSKKFRNYLDTEDILDTTNWEFHERLGKWFLHVLLYEKLKYIQPNLVEKLIEIDIKNGNILTTKLDLLDLNNKLYEFKTSSKPYDETEPKNMEQLLLYAIAVEKVSGSYPSSMEFIVLVKGNEEIQPHIQYIRVIPPPREKFEELENELDEITRKISTPPYIRKFDPYRCTWCEYQKHCIDELNREKSF
ncbi:MAG: PD-(D/E)XK nuclease family protein [bacterium]|nr:PD-(D/E)XK nuclease family protein [bacterium]